MALHTTNLASRLRPLVLVSVLFVTVYFLFFSGSQETIPNDPTFNSKQNAQLALDTENVKVAQLPGKNFPTKQSSFFGLSKKNITINQLPPLTGKTGFKPLKELSIIQKTFWKGPFLTVNLTNTAIKYISLLPPVPKSNVCLVSTFEGDYVPDYVKVFVESVAQQSEYASLSLFIHTRKTTTKTANFPTSEDLPSDIRIFDLKLLSTSYRTRGFPGFVSDRICEHFKETAENCDKLEATLRQYEKDYGSILSQIKGLYPIIFPRWINSDRCNSWAFVSPDTIVGNLQKWLDNPTIAAADVVTLNTGDLGRIYLREQFTIHNLQSTKVNTLDLWKQCTKFSTFDNLVQAFQIKQYESFTEGCYSAGILSHDSPKLTVLSLPWRLGDNINPNALQLADKHLTYCAGQGTSEICRGQLKTDLKIRQIVEIQRTKALAQLNQTDKADTRALLPHIQSLKKFGRPANLVFAPSESSLDPTFGLLQVFEQASLPPTCSEWLPTAYQRCVEEIPKLQQNEFAYLQEITTGVEVVAKLLKYERPADWVDPGMSHGVAETLAARVPQDWLEIDKTKNTSKRDRVLDVGNVFKKVEKVVVDIGPVAERTWWYSSEKGSILISKTKIMFHTLQGYF
ncbi:hypothetical protein HK096_008459 [Nowakowskiella sp. JEL0078]|nr:hypothetical protein HK096_008459 [Nowakowskiella sp. JEL0078]